MSFDERCHHLVFCRTEVFEFTGILLSAWVSCPSVDVARLSCNLLDVCFFLSGLAMLEMLQSLMFQKLYYTAH